MRKYLRISGYTFLALSGLYAWIIKTSGWEHYVGLAMFFLATVRVFTLLKPKQSAGTKIIEKQGAMKR